MRRNITAMPTSFDCERRDAAVPRDCQLMGFALADYASLVTEGAYLATERNNMSEQMMGVVRHVLTAVGAVLGYTGFVDDATWTTVMGSLMVMIPMVWSWMAK